MHGLDGQLQGDGDVYLMQQASAGLPTSSINTTHVPVAEACQEMSELPIWYHVRTIQSPKEIIVTGLYQLLTKEAFLYMVHEVKNPTAGNLLDQIH